MSPLTVKILGRGNAAKKHAIAFEALPELYQITESDEADIVDICTPNASHYLQCHAALAEGQHAIVEKPVCGSLADMDTLMAVERLADRTICPIFQYRFAGHDPVGSQIITRWQRDAAWHNSWWGDWEQAFGGALTSHGIHAIDLILETYGMPKIVIAGMDTYLGPEKFADVMMGEPGDMLRVATFIGEAVAQGGFILGDSHTGYVKQFKLLHHALTTGSALPVTLAQARQSLEVLTAAYWSAYTGEPAMLPIEPSNPFYQGWSTQFAQRSRLFRVSQKIHGSLEHPDDPPKSDEHLSLRDWVAEHAR